MADGPAADRARCARPATDRFRSASRELDQLAGMLGIHAVTEAMSRGPA